MTTIRIDPQIYSGAPDCTDGRSERELRSYAFLNSLEVPYYRLDHDHADTIEACQDVETILGVHICKNLFLCNRQATDFYLLMMPGDKPFKTKDLSKILGTSRLSFASAENMLQHLDLLPGSVTVLGLINDTEKKVQLVIDSRVLQDEYIGCHPCTSTSSLKVKTDDLLCKILPALGIVPRIIDLPEIEA